MTRYATWAALLRLLPALRQPDRPPRPSHRRLRGRTISIGWSDAICTALQLTNFWQDVKSDYARGRIYLPLEEMRAHGAEEATLAGGRITPEWRDAIAAAVAGHARLFNDGLPLCDRLRGRLRYEIRATWLGGTRILDRLEAVSFDVLSHRPTIGAADIPWLAGAVLGWPRSIQRRAART